MFIFEQCPKNFSGKVFAWKPARSQLRFNTTDSTNPLNLAPSDGNALATPRIGPAKKTTRRGMSIRSRRWNMEIRRWSGLKDHIGDPRKLRGTHEHE